MLKTLVISFIVLGRCLNLHFSLGLGAHANNLSSARSVYLP